MKYLITAGLNLIIMIICLYYSIIALDNHHIFVFCYGVLMAGLNIACSLLNVREYIFNRKIKVLYE